MVQKLFLCTNFLQNINVNGLCLASAEEAKYVPEDVPSLYQLDFTDTIQVKTIFKLPKKALRGRKLKLPNKIVAQ